MVGGNGAMARYKFSIIEEFAIKITHWQRSDGHGL